MDLTTILEAYRITIDLEEVLDRWREPHRGYHNLDHLNDLIDQIEKDLGVISVEERDKLLLVALFHDVIYEPTKTDNVEKSAAFMLAYCEDKALVKDVYQAILDTKYHKSNEPLSERFNRYDMNIVERDFDSLLRWEHGIRKEYSMYSAEEYQQGRVKFLESLLDQYPENRNNLVQLIKVVRGL